MSIQEVYTAARAGKMRRLKQLHKMGISIPEHTYVCAAWGGHLSIIKQLRKWGYSWGDGSIMCEAAATGGHIRCLKYAHKKGCGWGCSVLRASYGLYKGGTRGYKSCVEYMVKQGLKRMTHEEVDQLCGS